MFSRSFVRPLSAGIAALCIAQAASAQVKISQIYGGGGNTASMFLSDYIEIYNAGAPQDLTGWSVQYASSTGTTWQVTALPAVVLGSGQYLLVKQANGTTLPAGQSISLPTPDASGTISMSATDAKVALVSAATAISGGTPTYAAIPTLVDFVGFGTATWNESAAAGGVFAAANNAPPGSNTNAIFRLGCGATDTAANVADFAVGLPQPRNTLSAPNGGLTGGTLVSPFYAEELQTVRILCQPYLCGTLLASPGTTVLVDLSAIGGAAGTAMLDDGTGGDEFAGDGLFSVTASIAAGTTPGSKNMPVTFTDGFNTGGVYASLEVTPITAPNNDNCASATAIAGPYNPAVVLNDNFTGATAEFNATSGTPSMSSRRGLWYTVVGTGNSISVDTCASPLNGTAIPDTMMHVYGGTCDSLTIVGYNDDVATLCGVGTGTERRSRVTWCSVAGATYYVCVVPFSTGAQTFNITLTVLDDATPCSTATPIGTCPPVLSGGNFENEPGFGVSNNDGCGSSPNLFVSATPGFPAQRWLGTARAFANNRENDWYRFQAPYTDTFTVRMNAQFNGVVQFYSLGAGGACPSTFVGASPVSVRCATTSFSTVVTGGNWYAVQVLPTSAAYPGGSTSTMFGGIVPGPFNYHYTLDLEIGAPPANDFCANASPLGTVNGANLANGTNDGSSTCDANGKDVWYAFTAPAAGTLNLDTCTSTTDTVISVFDVCGGTELACNDDASGTPCAGPASALSLVMTGGQSVVIRVSDKNLGGVFTLTSSFALPNDECAGATAIGGSGSFPADNTFASVSSGAPSACATFGKDVWFAWTSQGAGLVQVDTCGASQPVLDSVVAVYTGTCGTLTQIACDDDSCATPTAGSQLTFTADCTTTYYIRVGAWSTSVGGAWTLNITAPGFVDSDGDGVDDCLDGCPFDPLKLAPGVCGCGVADVDTDGDGTFDCFDNCPLDPAKIDPGQCGCGVSDVDSDGDGVADCNDLCPNDPNKVTPGQCGCGIADTDTDGDLVADCNDGCPLDPNKVAPGICGCGVSDVDSDGDGTADCNDGCPQDPNKIAAGQCGCGVPDTDSDGDGTADCNDLCPNDGNKIAPGQCGCGVPDTDTDNDGVADCVDNCDNLANPNQEDCDLDGVGDICELAAGTAFDVNVNGIPDNCEAGVLSYCTAGTSLAGCVPQITATGTPSASAPSGFVVVLSSADGQRFSQVYYGVSGPAALPFGAGYLCVAPPRQRMAGQLYTNGTNGNCDGGAAIDLQIYAAGHPAALGMPLTAGVTYYFQATIRDNGNTNNRVQSNAFAVTLIP